MSAADDDIRFGTSGLRGLASAFSQSSVEAYVGGFLEICGGAATEKTLVIGRDLRTSSPEIAARVARAARHFGWAVIDCGAVPTPALALYALGRSVPAIMVTGSHIPADRNGLKFYAPGGEISKSQEAGIARAAQSRMDAVPAHSDPFDIATDPAALALYKARYLDGFASDALKGLRVGVFTHSAVGRDLMPEMFGALGATCIAFGHSEIFVPVDTEALEPDMLAAIRDAITADALDCVGSTDADGDRPLLIDETGNQINGDVLGALTARFLGAGHVVTPLTSTTGIEQSGWFGKIIRTAIGSPFVIKAMQELNGEPVTGFEANGGVLISDGFTLPGGKLAALPTRDALLPLIAVLSEAKAQGMPVSQLAASLPPRAMRADRLKHVEPERGNALVAALAQSRAARAALDDRLADPLAIDTLDGTRLTLADGAIVHFRQSGNAPELRCYVETGSFDATGQWLAVLMAALTDWRGRG